MSLNGKGNDSKQILSTLNTIETINKYDTTRNLGIRTSNGTSTNTNLIAVSVAGGFSETVDSSLDTFDSILAPNMPVNSIEITFPAAATTIQLSSSSADDTAAGIGAVAVQINGLSSTYAAISEIIVMAGTSGSTASTNSFLRVNDLIVVSSGSNVLNVGQIYVSPSTDTIGGTTAGVPDTLIFNTIKPTTNLSTTAIYTVPLGFDFLPEQVIFSSDTTSTRVIDARFWFRLNNLGLPVFESAEAQVIGGTGEFNVDVFTFPEKMDYYITAVGSVAQASKIRHLLNGVLKNNSSL